MDAKTAANKDFVHRIPQFTLQKLKSALTFPSLSILRENCGWHGFVVSEFNKMERQIQSKID